ncbi:MAG: CDGSH iron-sulfur domain-containing protein [Phycisphaerales bacterium]|nr:CDGSH iron-sulfur domain-containing protein [Phycisphaerales bacterium]
MAEPIHGQRPMVVEETAGKKAYCMCGHSANLPYCDGSHSREQTGVGPCVVEITENKRVSICQCHKSANLPFCDGTHKKIG